jgi:hypothetical protein
MRFEESTPGETYNVKRFLKWVNPFEVFRCVEI